MITSQITGAKRDGRVGNFPLMADALEPAIPAGIIDLQDHSVFEPEEIDAMALALENVCKVLHINDQTSEREIIAARIIALARRGILDANLLCERVIAQTKRCNG